MDIKKIVVTTSAAAVATASCLSVMAPPAPVHADFGEFAGAVDYITALSGEDATTLLSGDGGIVAGLMLAVYMLAHPNLHTSSVYNAENIVAVSGRYIDGEGKSKICTLLGFPNNYNVTDGGIVVLYSEDFEIGVTPPANTDLRTDGRIQPAGDGVYSYYNFITWVNTLVSNTNTTSGVLQGSSNFSSYDGYTTVAFFTGARPVPPQLGNTRLSTFVYDGSSQAVFDMGVSTNLPSGTLDPANPDPYINNVLRPYIETNYPEYVYLLPDAPYEPEYPTEFVTGIPKDWTITNPQLPTMPDLSLDIPDATLPSVDVSSELGQYADGVRFWWALTGWVLDTLGIKTLVIVFMIIGIAVFALYKIGG